VGGSRRNALGGPGRRSAQIRLNVRGPYRDGPGIRTRTEGSKPSPHSRGSLVAKGMPGSPIGHRWTGDSSASRRALREPRTGMGGVRQTGAPDWNRPLAGCGIRVRPSGTSDSPCLWSPPAGTATWPLTQSSAQGRCRIRGSARQLSWQPQKAPKAGLADSRPGRQVCVPSFGVIGGGGP